jgi:two-component system, sensor histidine kinase LadS
MRLTAPWLLCLALWIAAPPQASAQPDPVAPADMLQPKMLLEADPAAVGAIVSGARDAGFLRYSLYDARRSRAAFWLRAEVSNEVLLLRRGRHLAPEVFIAGDAGAPLQRATRRSSFRGTVEDAYFVGAAQSPRTVYVRVAPEGDGAEQFELLEGRIATVLGGALADERIIAAAFATLMAMAIAALLIWFVLPERLFLLYGSLFSLQALYIAYLAGPGFDWPVLRWAAPLQENTWNVTAAVSGWAACLFVREIADLRRYSPRVYSAFGWMAWGFLALAASNALVPFVGGAVIADIGNLMFLGTALFTVIVAFLAWRRGNRAAGWFLIAWMLLEVMTITTAVSFLLSDDLERLLYVGLPASMVAAAILVALGVADRLREQRAALGDAERRAQLDSLTGVLNRRSLLERLDVACQRAQARGLPISLLFIDLDHFKAINDSHGHLAGDACLRAIIAPIQSELRQSDVIGRYGGEEFIVILSSADGAAAQAIADRIRARIAELRVDGFGETIRLTCSIGVAATDVHGVWGEALVARADAAVYAAKRAGRNQVRAAEIATPA